jgi:hypothetical protein
VRRLRAEDDFARGSDANRIEVSSKRVEIRCEQQAFQIKITFFMLNMIGAFLGGV